VRRMLGEVDADVYVIVDGDATYDAASAPRMVEELVANDLDRICSCFPPASPRAGRLNFSARR